MLNYIQKYTSRDNSELSAILEPVSAELMLLEKRLVDDLSNENPLLNQVIQYIIQAGGKRLRPAVTFLFAKALNKGYLSSSHFQLGMALELIHTATLIHDDTIDETDSRRSRVTINRKWNNKTAVITGDFLLSRSLVKLASVKNYSVIEIFSKIMGEICEGEIQQGLQAYQFVSLDEYIEKSRRKTANLFVAGTECSAILTPDVDNLTVKIAREYSVNFGIAFQIVDDILNFTSSEKESGKPAGIDLRDGILTAPVLYAFDEYSRKGDSTLRKLADRRFQKKGDLDKALDLIFRSEGIRKAGKLAGYYADMADKSLELLEDSPYKRALSNLALYILDRKY